MLVRFEKQAPASQSDTLTCVRPDGTRTSGPMPRQGILPRAAFHFVVESTLGWKDAFFGRIARGASIDELAHEPEAAAAEWKKLTQARQSASLVACLEADQWGGAADPAAFAQNLVTTCRRQGVAPPDITADELAKVRVGLREFGAVWRPLHPGAVLERTF